MTTVRDDDAGAGWIWHGEAFCRRPGRDAEKDLHRRQLAACPTRSTVVETPTYLESLRHPWHIRARQRELLENKADKETAN